MIYKSDFGDIYYETYGLENSPVLVFTHGIIMDHQTFRDQVKAFSQNYRVVLWDMPGHGKSFPVGDQFSFSMVSKCLIGLLDEIKADTAILLGVSLGGHIAQYTAYHYSQRITAIVAIGSIPLHKKHSKLMRVLLELFFKLSLPLIPEMALVRFNSRGKAIKPETINYLDEISLRTGKKNILKLHGAMFAGVFEGIAEPVKQPLLIAHGEKEVQFNINLARKWHKTNPESKYAVIQEAGHIANQDNPEEFNRIVHLFLEELEH